MRLRDTVSITRSGCGVSGPNEAMSVQQNDRKRRRASRASCKQMLLAVKGGRGRRQRLSINRVSWGGRGRRGQCIVICPGSIFQRLHRWEEHM